MRVRRGLMSPRVQLGSGLPHLAEELIIPILRGVYVGGGATAATKLVPISSRLREPDGRGCLQNWAGGGHRRGVKRARFWRAMRIGPRGSCSSTMCLEAGSPDMEGRLALPIELRTGDRFSTGPNIVWARMIEAATAWVLTRVLKLGFTDRCYWPAGGV